VQLWLAPYAAADFDNASFAEHGIAFPPALARAVRQRQAEYFHGRLCARAALAQIGLAGAGVGTGPAREPVWPAGAVGSITHSRTLAAALALPAGQVRGIGIDIEAHADEAALSAIANVVLDERELAFLRANGGALSEAVLMSVAFSAKESFYKAVYGVVGRFFDFSAVNIDVLDVERGEIGFTLTETLCPEWPRGGRWRAGFALLDTQHVLTGVQW
jgi:enterobactin synthetase component D